VAICPFNEKNCRTDCALYVAPAKNCVFMAMGVLLESIQNVTAYMHTQSIKEVEANKEKTAPKK